MSLKRASLLASMIVAFACSARAQSHWSSTAPPQCAGNDKSEAEHMRAEGTSAYRRAKGESGAAAAADFTAALASFDAACAAGDDSTLELRAYALAGLERWVEAAESLDAFLATHPLAALPEDVRSRVVAGRADILSRTASLSVESKPKDGKLLVNHRDMGTTPIAALRLPPGTYDLEVVPAEGFSVKRTITLTTGEHSEVFDFDAEPKPPATYDVKTVDVVAIHRTVRPTPWVPMAVGTAIGAGVLAAVGFGMVGWMNASASAYNDGGCMHLPQPAGCSDEKSQYGTAFNAMLWTMIPAGILAITSGVFFVMSTQKPTDTKNPGFGFWCAPGAGLTCGGAW